MVSRSFLILAIFGTFVYSNMTAPTCSSKRARAKKAATLSSYNKKGGLPLNTFSNFSGHKLADTNISYIVTIHSI